MTDQQTPTTDSIDITGLDVAEVILALHNNTSPLGLGFLHARDDVTIEDVREFLRNGSEAPGQWGPMRVDYMFGRPIKVNVPETGVIDLWQYNRDAGAGVGQRVIAELRAEATTDQ